MNLALLDAITRAQSSFIAHADSRTAFEGLLADLLAITGSEYGFIGEVLHAEDGASYLKTRAISNIAWDEATRHFYEEHAPQGMEFRKLDNLFGLVLTSGQSVIANDPSHDARATGLPQGHPPLNAFLGVPIHAAGRMVAMVGLANRAGGYDATLIHELQPLLSTIGQLVEARRMEEALDDSAHLTQAIFDNVLDGMISIDARGIVQSYNRAAERIFGYVADEVIGQNVKMLMPEPYRGKHDGYLGSYHATGVARIIGIGREVEGQRKDGSCFPLDLAVSEIQHKGRLMFIGVVRDITERKRMERIKDEFVSTVSHELRTPLTSIAGALGLLAGGAAGALPEQARHLLDIALKNSKRLTHLINDLLDIEKMAAGKMEFEIQSIPVASLLEQALEANKAYGDEHGVRFELAAVPEGVEIRADSQRLMQVLSNFLSNAAKFSPRGGAVQLYARRSGTCLRIEVTDHGPGIPASFRGRIFQKFSQADASDTRQKGGTGLGLAISKELVERMGGTIGFTSEEGRGATFFCEFPVSGGQGHVEPLSPPNVGAGAPRILLVEDDPEVAELLGMMLQRAGYHVVIAASGGQALERLEHGRYDAMTLDLMLPDMSGLEVMHRARSSKGTEELPIIVVSASVEDGRLAISGDLPNVEWLPKPIDEHRLFAAVDKARTQGASRPARVLHVEDDPDLHEVVRAMAGKPYDFEQATTLAEAEALLALERFDIVILDIQLPDGSGWDLLPRLRQLDPRPRVIVLSGTELGPEDAAKVESSLLKTHFSPRELLDTLSARIVPNPA